MLVSFRSLSMLSYGLLVLGFSGLSHSLSDIGSLSRTDHCLSLRTPLRWFFIFILYVDDIVLIGNTLSLISSFISTSGTEFVIKDLGFLYYFFFWSWGVSLSFGLHLSHTWYFIDLLHHSSMNECKPCSTPLFATFCTLLSIVTWSTLFNIWLWLVL